MKAAKINARIKLGFSSTLAAVTFDNDSLYEIPDILGTDATTGESNAAVMTDGCGFISHFLAQQIPYAVKSGVPFNFDKLNSKQNDNSSRPNTVRSDSAPLPVIIQVRITSSKGLFKGCLVVTDDDSLCLPYCVAVRPCARPLDPSPTSTTERC